MDITIDVRISGCATRCWHCYVSGGPGPLMPLKEYKRCLEALDAVCDGLEKHGFSVYLWLDYEPLLHPDICEILRTTKERFGDHFDASSFPTAGIPIAARPDWEKILETLREVGTREIMFTLHGPAHLHDEALGRPGSFERHSLALRRVQAGGFETVLKLIVSKDMLQHFEETMEVVHGGEYDYRRAEVPIYEPVPRLRQFESHRATLEDVEPFRERLSALCNRGRGSEYWREADRYAERNVLRDVLAYPDSYPDFVALEAQAPPWIFVTVAPGLSIYHGNAGLYLQELGTLSDGSPEHWVERVRTLRPNYLFSGFYDVRSLPALVDVARGFGDPNSGKLYHTVEDVFFRWLGLMDVEN